MDKSAIEKFSINARAKLRNSIDSSMAKLGFGPGREVESVQSVGDITVITLPGGIQTRISNDEAKYRERLAELITKDGYDNVVEQVAYTWFNRLIAIRYMEVNDFLPTHVRVLSSNNPEKTEPDLVSQCLTVNLGLSDSERGMISELRDTDRLDELFSKMFIFECRSLNRILPELFTLTKPYENMLLNLSYTSPDSVVRSLVDDITEDDFKDAVQIIGWMYQYYNSELKDQTFADLKKNVKIPKERIPAATQLFTPDWIVRYMVENSVGRVWLEGHPDHSLRSSWKYYVDEAEQKSDVFAKLAEIRAPRADMMPSDIKVIDPCMGSGHILVYAFDVLMQIYLSYGYSKSDAAEMILTDNLYGLDIDDRAYQLAYFAVMMKARQYDPDVFYKNLRPNLHSIPESNGIDVSALEGYGKVLSTLEQTAARNDLMYLLTTFRDAKTYGSLLKVRNLDWDNINKFLKGRTITLFSNPEIDSRLHEIVDVAKILSIKYDVAVTNPPYLSSSNMNLNLYQFVKDNYSDVKSDLYSCFIKRLSVFVINNGFLSMITQQSFMFLPSFEKLRHIFMEKFTMFSMLHLGSRAFDQISGEVVQSVSFIICNKAIPHYICVYKRLIDGMNEQEKESMFFNKNKQYCVDTIKFQLIPGSPLAYWVPEHTIELFNNNKLSSVSNSRIGLATGRNDKYLRLWFEVDFNKIGFGMTRQAAYQSGLKWFPYDKGGDYRKWYGNRMYIVDWQNDGYELQNTMHPDGKRVWAHNFNLDYIFKEHISWTNITTGTLSFRLYESGFLFDSSASVSFVNDENITYPLLGYLNSYLIDDLSKILNPTLHFNPGDYDRIPLIDIDEDIGSIAKENVSLSKIEWNSKETSWEFSRCPLVKGNNLEFECKQWIHELRNMAEKLFTNDELINSIIESKCNIPYTKPTSNRYLEIVKDEQFWVKQLVSYSVGCMFGRYSLDKDGVQFVGHLFSSNSIFEPDEDNIIPIFENDYFGDDIVTRFVDFIKIVYGVETLEQNLKYIANCLDTKNTGTARDKIRLYFMNDFYKDHLRIYSNLPIYWLFDSGKANGFKALIYMHRYTPDLIGKMRQDYLLPMQRRYTEQLKTESDSIARSKLEKKLEEIATYDLAMELYSSNKVSIDLDDGIKVNYAKFQNIDNPGGKGKINLLYKIK